MNVGPTGGVVVRRIYTAFTQSRPPGLLFGRTNFAVDRITGITHSRATNV